MGDIACKMERYFKSRVAFYLHADFEVDVVTAKRSMEWDGRSPREGAEWLKIDQRALTVAMVLAEEDWMEELRSHLVMNSP